MAKIEGARVADGGSPAGALDLYRAMVRIRAFEDEMQRLFLRGEVHGTVHLYTGQEACSVGVCSALIPGDQVAATYRGHGAALAMGTEPRALAAELMGRSTGVCGGRAGSMNVVDREHGLIGCFGIVGGSIAAATGAALALRRSGGVAVAFFGDGAANHGYFHECLNFAAVQRLPVVFVCENNLYGEFTPMAAVTAGGDIRARAAGYAMPAEKVDGNDVVTVRTVAERAIDHARRGDGPAFLECMTYRHVGHSKTDPATYRPAGELETWLERDPLLVAAAALAEAGIDPAEIDESAAATRAEVAADVAAAVSDPYPDPGLPVAEYA
ncbi:MAG TPA: thiamine pyrophosphate-dependent dehydrogenase E1 component subunit alpha [Gaiellales bacterium]|nr:thiamine pyrophosphate-dependent dehydrogenase E1 component subunit alpha [Gaiellales bacterium]